MFLVILAIGVAIRLIGLGQQSFWYDEIHSVDLAWGAPTGSLLMPVESIHGPRRRTRYPLWRMMVVGLLVAIILSPWLIRGAYSTGRLSLSRPAGKDVRLAVKGESPRGLLSIPYTFYNFSLGCR